jgi:uncharacterized protein YxjI
MRYHLKERILNIKDDFVVRDDAGNDIFDIKGDLLHIGDTWKILDAQTRQEILFVKQRLFTQTREYDLIRDNTQLATVRMQRPGHQTRFEGIVEVSTRDGAVIELRGDFQEWEFDVMDHYGHLLGHISKEFAIMRDYYTVDTAPNVDGPFVIALAVILDELKEDHLVK